MAPTRKRKSDEMADPSTPEASGTPAPKKMRITQMQKQALIDNLQLEITERARHLRAHYALQCADLKSRIERRINRIPMSMRSMTMKELMEKHQIKPAPPRKQSPVKPIAVAKTQSNAPARATRKRKSSIVIAADPPQEHEPSNQESAATIQPAVAPKSNPKGAKRPASRTGRGAGGVLSPRSHNSRTLPRSPIKGNPADSATDYSRPAPPSPAKSHIARPMSPLKPHSPLKSAAIATTSAISSSVHTILSTAKSTATRGVKATTRPATTTTARAVSQASNHSATSNATATSTGTVVKNAETSKPKTVRGRAAAATKKAATALNAGIEKSTATKEKAATKATRAGTVKKPTTAAAKKAAAEPAPATGRRILRKRN